MLKPGAAARQVVMAFDLGNYICERLQPDAAQASRWLEKLITALLKVGVPDERRPDVAAAVLALLRASPTSVKLRWARGCLLSLEIDPSGAQPAAMGGQGFQSVLPQTKTLDELWPQLQEIRTPAEQVRAYIAALNNCSTNGDFTALEKAAEEAWPMLKQALETKNASKIYCAEDADRTLSKSPDRLTGTRGRKAALPGHRHGEELLRLCPSLAGRLIWKNFH
jgi:hypothetical protein